MDIDITDRAPETKAGGRSDIDAHDEMMRTFEEYKAANDERLAKLERGKADVLFDEKMARMDAAIDALTLKQARPHLDSRMDTAPTSPARREHGNRRVIGVELVR